MGTTAIVLVERWLWIETCGGRAVIFLLSYASAASARAVSCLWCPRVPRRRQKEALAECSLFWAAAERVRGAVATAGVRAVVVVRAISAPSICDLYAAVRRELVSCLVSLARERSGFGKIGSSTLPSRDASHGTTSRPCTRRAATGASGPSLSHTAKRTARRATRTRKRSDHR